MTELDRATLVKLLSDFFTSTGRVADIELVADFFGDRNKSVYVKFQDIFGYDNALAEHLLRNPDMTIAAAEEAMYNLFGADNKRHIHFRVTGLPEAELVHIRDIGEEHIGKLIAVNGIVQRWTQKKPLLKKAVFMCVRCGNTNLVIIQDSNILEEPYECTKDSGGCGRSAASTKFELLQDKSTFVNLQRITIQEPPENLRGTIPTFVEVHIEDDLCGKLDPGFRVILNAIARSRPQRRGTSKLTVFDKWLKVVSFDILDQPYEEVKWSEEDEVRIRAESMKPELFDNLIGSIAPTIYGYETEKEAIALQLFGGVAKVFSDATRGRGDIHILMVGDPGQAKSQILTAVANIAPRSVSASGKHASGAGLTVAVVRDSFGDESRWTLEAGAMVLADTGHACIDEFDKMNPEDRKYIHNAMEQQVIDVAKAGITAHVNSRCSVLAAANPKGDRFEDFEPIPNQINLPPTLLSRFDVIFAIQDKPNEVHDAEVARHMLTHHRNKGKEHAPDQGPHYDTVFLRKYIAYAKGIEPELTGQVEELLTHFYVTLRSQRQDGSKPIPITPRQLNALIRLSEASARARLRTEVLVDDAERAIRIFLYYLTNILKGDIDIVETGISHVQRTRAKIIYGIIEELSLGGKGAEINEIMDYARDQGIVSEQTRRDLEHMKTRNQIYSTDGGNRYRLAKD